MLDAMREYDESALDSPEDSEPDTPNLAEMLAANPVAEETTAVATTFVDTQEAPAAAEPAEAQLEAQSEAQLEIQRDEPHEEQATHGDPQADFVENAEPSPAPEQNSVIAEPEHSDRDTDTAPILHEESLLRTPSSDFEIMSNAEDSATGYTESAPEPNEQHSEASIVLGAEEQVSLLEKILAELANHHIGEEQHPSDLADKEAQ
jgi:hypothetical protein